MAMMVVPLVMAMRIRVMVVMAMIVMMMVMPMPGIVRLERGSDRGALKPMLRQQRFDLGPLLQPDAAGQNLHRDMAIAERKEEARDRREILGPHLDHRLDVGHDLGEPAVVKHQEIVGVQAGRRRKVELDARALAAEHETLLLATVVEFQQQRIDDLAKRHITCHTNWRVT